MRLSLLVFTAVLAAARAGAQTPPASAPPESSSTVQDLKLPVSLDRIRGKLEQPPTLTMLGIGDVPNFKVEVQEKQKLDDLVTAVLKGVKKVPVPAEGVYMQEMQRQWWPAVDNPLMQPYAAFNQSELATIAVENVVGSGVIQLLGLAFHAMTSAEHANAERAARDEVRAAIATYCAAQPNQGAGIQICGPQD